MAGKSSSLPKGQLVIRACGQTTCVTHRHTTLDWFCKTCSDVICAKCISTTHSGHTFVQLCDETPNIKNKIRKFVKEAEVQKVHQIQQKLKFSDETLKHHLHHFNDVATKVKKQGENLKEELNLIISQTLSQVKFLEEEYTKQLMTYRTELETKLEELKKHLNACRESLQTGTDVQLFDVACGLDKESNLPRKPSLGTVTFTPSMFPNRFLEQAFGIMEITLPNQPAGNSDASTKTSRSLAPKPLNPVSNARPLQSVQNLCGSSGDRSSETQTQSQWERKGNFLIQKYKIREYPENLKNPRDPPVVHFGQHPREAVLPHTKLLKTWKPPCDITSICPAGDEGMWTCDNSDNVTLLSDQGRMEKQRLNPVGVRDICTSPNTHNLWACSHIDNSVTELPSSGILEFRFKTTDTPRCICVTMDDHVLVGMKNKIVKYDPEGKLVQTVGATKHGKPVVCTPWKMSQCPVTENVAVVDRDKVLDGGKDKPHILVITNQLQQIFRYGRPQHNSVLGSRPFDPCDVTYDRLGQLIIADRDDRSLHLISGDGQYVRRLHNGIGPAWFVSVDRKEVLWAVFSYGGKQVDLIQYE